MQSSKGYDGEGDGEGGGGEEVGEGGGGEEVGGKEGPGTKVDRREPSVLLFALLITSYLTFPSHATQAHGRFRAISAYLINPTLVII